MAETLNTNENGNCANRVLATVFDSDAKQGFANFMADHTFLGMNECERYGMTWGCDTGCPVLRAGKCELQNDDNKELYEQWLSENGG